MLVSVPAGCFDDPGDSDVENRWSAKFQNGAKHELFGVVDRAYATRCSIYFFDDKMTTKVDIDNLHLKADQDLVVLKDGSTYRREGFSRLVPLDSEKVTQKITVPGSLHADEARSTFEFSEPNVTIENSKNRGPKRRGDEQDVIAIGSAKRPCSSPSNTIVPDDFEMNWPSDALSESDQQVINTPTASTSKKLHATAGDSSSQATVNPSHVTAKTPKKITVPRTRVKKLPIYQRPVKSLAEAEVVSNYESSSQQDLPEKTLTTVIKLSTAKNAPTRTLNFSTKTKTKVRRSECDMIVGKPGPTKEVQHIVKPLQGFDYYFQPELQLKLVSFVNKRIVATLQSQIIGM